MRPITYKLSSNNNVIIIPHIDIVQDGHPILVHHYDIFDAGQHTNNEPSTLAASVYSSKESENYIGELTFNVPGKLFTYRYSGNHQLNTEDERNIISFLSELRDDSVSWRDFIETNKKGKDS